MKPGGVARVSQLVKTLAAVALIGAAVLVWYLRREHAAAPAQAAPSPAGSAAPSVAPRDPAAPRPPAHVRRVTAEQRKQLAEQIARARAGRAAAGPTGGSTPAPALPDRPTLSKDDPEQFRTTMKTAMREVAPYLAECYDKAPDLPSAVSVVAKLSLVGDPDVGTLIDTDGVTDDKEGALPSAFDLCLRDSLANLQLPPLAEGEEVKVTYPFMFTR